MRPLRSLAPLLALALLAAPAHADPGISLRWDQCLADGGVLNKNFACDTNDGLNVLVSSFVPAATITDVADLEFVIDMASASAAWPAWWRFFQFPGSCRIQSLKTPLVPTNSSAILCQDWSRGHGVGGIATYNIGNRGPNSARIVGVAAVPSTLLQVLTGGSEYWGFELTIDHAQTLGANACGGCSIPVCIVFASLRMTTPVEANDRTLQGPSNHTDSDFVTWQGGGTPVVGGVAGCPAATPTQRSNWGAVKSLYR